MKNFSFPNKVLILLFGFSLLANISKAQKIDYKEIILPKTDSVVLLAMGLSLYEEKLVQLAWQNYPASEIYSSRVEIARKNINLERLSWADDIYANFNFNERSINDIRDNLQDVPDSLRYGFNGYNANLYPYYNFGVKLSIGTFVNTPIKVGIAKEYHDIAVATLNQQKLSIRAEVLKRYKDYQLKVELLKIRTQAQEDAYSTHLLITRDFENGVATLEEFINSAAAYNNSIENKLIADKNVLESKITLEEMLGVKLEDVGK